MDSTFSFGGKNKSKSQNQYSQLKLAAQDSANLTVNKIAEPNINLPNYSY